MSPTAPATHFALPIDKRLTIGAIVAAGIALLTVGWNASTANGRIESAMGRITTLEGKATLITEVNERTIRMEEQLKAIRERMDRNR